MHNISLKNNYGLHASSASADIYVVLAFSLKGRNLSRPWDIYIKEALEVVS